jgi:hypothetical protein
MKKSKLKKQIKELKDMSERIEKLGKKYETKSVVYANSIRKHAHQISDIITILENATASPKTAKIDIYGDLTKAYHESYKQTFPELTNTIVTNAMFNEQTSQILLDIRNSQLQLIAYQALDTILATGLQYTHIQSLITSILIKKGNEYSQETDRYSNFIEDDITIPQAIKNYQQKHIRWLLDYQDGKIQANILLILEHCIDIINYSILLKVWEKFNG